MAKLKEIQEYFEKGEYNSVTREVLFIIDWRSPRRL